MEHLLYGPICIYSLFLCIYMCHELIILKIDIFISIYIHIYKHMYIYIHRWMDNLYGTPIVWTTMAGSTILSSRCVLVCQCVCHELYDMCHELNILKIDL